LQQNRQIYEQLANLMQKRAVLPGFLLIFAGRTGKMNFGLFKNMTGDV